ncbi:MAG TPA: response regulator [Planctomycetota bacterium]|nr:response regulator [Planctomycetota bacterium]
MIDATKPDEPAPATPTVLVIEDEPKIRRFLRAALEAQGHRVVEAATAKEGLALAATHPPEIVVLDLGLPDRDGLEVTRELREWSSMPILVLSARGSEGDKVAALDAGADDYITKPFGVAELAARIRVALRHASRVRDEPDGAAVEVGELRIDLAARVVSVGGREARLTPTEFRLAAALAKHAGKVVTHEQLLREVWGPSYERETQYLRVFMASLRRKVESDPAQPRYLLTETGVGYRLASE